MVYILVGVVGGGGSGGSGGLYGGGDGLSGNGGNGLANTGGGGGGAIGYGSSDSFQTYSGGSGGSGVVFLYFTYSNPYIDISPSYIQFPDASQQITAYKQPTIVETNTNFSNLSSGSSGKLIYCFDNVSPYDASGGIYLTSGTYMVWLGVNFQDPS